MNADPRHVFKQECPSWPSPTEVIADIYAGQTRDLTRYVRALDHAAVLLYTCGPFESIEAAREHCLRLADRHARTDPDETKP
jgi:hypothetical protein